VVVVAYVSDRVVDLAQQRSTLAHASWSPAGRDRQRATRGVSRHQCAGRRASGARTSRRGSRRRWRSCRRESGTRACAESRR
jgi:hypothetical protein